MADKNIRLHATTSADLTGFEKIKRGVSEVLKKIGAMPSNVLAAFNMIKGAAETTFSAIQHMFEKGFNTDREAARFQQFIKNADEAREHIRMLQDLGTTPQYNAEEFGKASLELMKMTEGALGFRDSLNLVADAAFATGTPIDDVARQIGRLWGQLRDGTAVTRTTMSLRNMGIISPMVADNLNELQKSGASFGEMWGVVETELNKYNGSQQRVLETGDGLMGMISGHWDNAIREFCETMSHEFIGGLEEMLSLIKDLKDDKSIQDWCEGISTTLKTTVKIVEPLIGALKKLFDLGINSNATPIVYLLQLWKGLLNGDGISNSFDQANLAVKNLWGQDDFINGSHYSSVYYDKQLRDDKAKKEAEIQKAEQIRQQKLQEKEEEQARKDAEKAQREAQTKAQRDAERLQREEEARKQRELNDAKQQIQREQELNNWKIGHNAKMKAFGETDEGKKKEILMEGELQQLIDKRFNQILTTNEEDRNKLDLLIAEKREELKILKKQNETNKRNEALTKAIDEAKDKLDKMVEHEEKIKEYMEKWGIARNDGGDRWGTAADNLTGAGRKQQRNEAKLARRQAEREKRREEMQRRKENQLRWKAINRPQWMNEQDKKRWKEIQDRDRKQKAKEALEKQIKDAEKKMREDISDIHDNMKSFLQANGFAAK